MKMNTEALFLFLILLLGLLFCSILGGNCGKEGFEPKNTQLTGLDSPRDSVVYEDNIKTSPNTKQFDNYNHFNQSKSELTNGMTFYGPNGGTVVVKTDSDGKQMLEVMTTSADIAETYNQDKKDAKQRFKTVTFHGPNNSNATIIKNHDGQIAIRVKNNKGVITYTLYGTTPFNPEPLKEYYKLPTETPANPEVESSNTVGTLFGLGMGQKDYFDALPKGIPKSKIPAGQEDLYILKSQVVPPSCTRCPSCPASKAVNAALSGTSGTSGTGGSQSNVSLGPGGYTVNNQESKCAPCPPCARCKEPDFECKKVPTYSPSNTYLPVPVLSNFSTFGM